MTKPESILEQRFSTWAFTTVEHFRKAVGIGAIFAAALSIKYLEPDRWLGIKPNEWDGFWKDHASGRASLALIQAVACFLLALLTPKPSIASLKRRKSMGKLEIAIANKACRRIQLFVVASYLAWSLYYLITGISLWQMSLQPTQDIIDRTISVNLNLIPSLLLFWLYLELAELTVEAPSPESKKNSETVSAEERSLDSSNAAFHRVISLGMFALIVALAWHAYAKRDETITNISEIASSCLNGVALALVVGRLGSRIIDPGSITLGLLYFYAIIQPTAATFHNNPAMQLFATTVALPLKVLLWLVIVWAFTTGILSEYVHEIRVLLTKERKSEINNE